MPSLLRPFPDKVDAESPVQLKNAASADIFLSLAPLLVALVLLPNLIAWLPLASFAPFIPGWINFEFVALGVLYLFWPSRLVLLAMGLELISDLFEPVALVYYFSTTDAIDALQYIGLVPLNQLLSYGAYLLVYIGLLVSAVYWSARKVRRVPLVAGLIIAILCVASIYQLTQMRSMARTDVTAEAPANRRLLRTPVLTIARRIKYTFGMGRAGTEMQLDSAVAQALRIDGAQVTQLRPNFVLVLLESWGEMLDPDSRDSIVEPYKSEKLASLYEIHSGLVPFHGATVSGESRELCGKLFSRGIDSATAGQLAPCLPQHLKDMGYDTLGIHGFAPRMYGRLHWYPRIGFSRFLFAPDLAHKGLHTCPAGLVGTCDNEVAELIRTELLTAAHHTPLFVHWVSLNSHLPVTAPPERIAKAHCETKPQALQDQAVCVWSYLVEQVHKSVVSMATDPRLSPTIFVIVGDHAPPFTSLQRRSLFFQQKVPYVILTPKALATDPH